MSSNTPANKLPYIDTSEIAETINRCNLGLDALENEEFPAEIEQAFDRDTVLEQLNLDFLQIPFEDLKKSSTPARVNERKSRSKIQEIERSISLEAERLSALARSLPEGVREQAIQNAQAKASQFAENHEAILNEARQNHAAAAALTRVAEEASELYGRPWFRSKSDRQGVEGKEDEGIEDEDIEDEYIPAEDRIGTDDDSTVSLQDIHERPQPGPYAELASQIPTLSDRLLRSQSVHRHVYGDIETLQAQFERTLGANFQDMTEDEKIAYWQASKVLPKFIPDLLNSKGELRTSHPIFRVYSAEDIFELQKRFREFTPKARAEFDGLEERVLSTAEKAFDSPEMQIPKDLESAIERMHAEAPARLGLQWKSLEKYAGLASDAIRSKLKAGGVNNQYLKDYIFSARDTSGTDPDFSAIYQFIADEFALETYAKRKSESSSQAGSRFEQNYQIILDWYEEAKGILEQVPTTLTLPKRKNGKPIIKFGKEVLNSWPAVRSIERLIEDIGIRRAGTGDPKKPRHKPLNLDRQGALNAQLALGYMVQELIDRLYIHDTEDEYTSEDIVPLD